MSNKAFVDFVLDFENQTVQDMEYVFVESVQDVLEAAQTPQRGVTKGASGFVEGKIPVAESELINSLVANDSAAGPDSYVLALGSFVLGQYLTFKWTAPHALRMEEGFIGQDKLGRNYKQEGRRYVGANADRFHTEFVPKRMAEV